MTRDSTGAGRSLRTVKLIHTAAWAFFVSAILAVPLFAWRRAYDRALVAAGIVVLEVAILAFNGWKCPLTAVAARYTDDRQPNFDIYLPVWLARYNKEVFGTLFVLGLLFLWVRWAGFLDH